MAGYTYKQRADKGFDFFDNNGKKIFIDQYVQATGANKNQLVNDLAKAGDRESQAVMRIPQAKRQAIFDREAANQKQRSQIFSVGNILNDLGKASADLGKGIIGGFQQGAGAVADVAVQGGRVLQNAGIQTNPFISQQQRQQQTKRFDQAVAGGNTVTDNLRRTIQSQKDINGNQIVGTSDVDRNAQNIARGNGNVRDYAAVLGKGLDIGTTATMFASPTSILKGTAGATPRQVLNFAGKDALMFGGVDGTAGFANTYGQTGDFGQSVKQGLVQGALSGLTQGTLDGLGFAARNTPKAIQNAPQTAKTVVEATTQPVKFAAKQDPRVTGFDEQYRSLAQQFDNLPAGSPERSAVSRAMAENRQARLGAMRGVQQEIGQGGYIKIPGADNDPNLEGLNKLANIARKYSTPEEFIESTKSIDPRIIGTESASQLFRNAENTVEGVTKRLTDFYNEARNSVNDQRLQSNTVPISKARQNQDLTGTTQQQLQMPNQPQVPTIATLSDVSRNVEIPVGSRTQSPLLSTRDSTNSALQRENPSAQTNDPIESAQPQANRLEAQPLQTSSESPLLTTVNQRSKFGNQTLQKSQEVSEPLKTEVRNGRSTYQATTDAERIAESDKWLKQQSVKDATTDVRSRLEQKSIDDQTVSDSIALAKKLDSKGTPSSLAEASDIYEQLSVKLSEAGQTIQAASLLNNRTPAGLQYGAIRALKKAGVEITPKIKEDITRLVNEVRKTKAGSYEDALARFNIQDYVAKIVPAKIGDKATTLWKAGLLTSPRTTMGNLLGNASEATFIKGYVDPVASMVDGIMSIFTGKRSKALTYRGLAGGGAEGIDKTVKYFKTGYDPRNPLQKFNVQEIHYSDTPLGKAAEKYTQGVFRLMGAADQPFYYAAQRNSLFDQAFVEAKNLKLTGKAKSDYVNKFISQPEKKALDLADREARYSVFQNETDLGNMASAIKNRAGNAKPLVDFIMPFTQVPSSVAMRLIDRTPVGVGMEIVKQIKSGKFDQRAMSKAIANGSAVLPLWAIGGSLYNAGAFTLGYPSDAKERKLWEAEGKQPYSIRIGDTWYSLNYLQPAGNLLAMGAASEQGMKDGKSWGDTIVDAAFSGVKGLTEQSFLQGVSGVLNAINDPQRFGQKFSESTAGSIIPNIIRTFARATDPVKREIDNPIESFIGGIPGARQSLDVNTDFTGEATPRNSGVVDEILNPFRPSQVRNTGNTVVEEARRLQDQKLGIFPTQSNKSAFPDKDEKELRKINNRVSQEVTSEWNRIIKDPRYNSLSDEDKKMILDKANDTAYGAIKSDYKDTKLNTLQTRYKNGDQIDYFESLDVANKSSDKAADKKVAKAKTTKVKSSRRSSGGGGGRRRGGITQDEISRLASLNTLSTKTASNLLDLLGSTTVRKKTSTPQTQKVALQKITVKG